jgi:1,4-alpha-glucan branching enzyme
VSVIAGQKSLLSDDDLRLFTEGSHFRLADAMGAHAGSGGTWFGVWAPAATGVSVIGDFNGWDPGADPLEGRGASEVWEALVPEAVAGSTYKYRVSAAGGDLNRLYREEPAMHALDFDPAGFEWVDARDLECPLPQSDVRESPGINNSYGRSESGLSSYAGPFSKGGEVR